LAGDRDMTGHEVGIMLSGVPVNLQRLVQEYLDKEILRPWMIAELDAINVSLPANGGDDY
jgi:hypothetical protein